MTKALGGYGNRGADVPVRAGANGRRVLRGHEINPMWVAGPDTLFLPTQSQRWECCEWSKLLELA